MRGIGNIRSPVSLVITVIGLNLFNDIATARDAGGTA